jgi:hypothetical protein
MIMTKEVQRNLFIECLEEESRLRLENCILPKTAKDLSLDELVQQTRSFCQQKCNIIVERVQLHRRQQQNGESVQAYYDALQQIAANCCFTPSKYDS